MSSAINQKSTTRVSYKQGTLQAEYFFSTTAVPAYASTTTSVSMDIWFVHPENAEEVKLRLIKSCLILVQPREVIDAIVQREVKQFFAASDQRLPVFGNSPLEWQLA